ncbi:MAG: hypothetical protein J5760_02835 [Clostridia bacterium]|nr:hypothetical protein [Clostridia bacterium]
MAEGLEIKEYSGEGYRRMVEFGPWTVAFLNWCPEFEKNTYIEAHLNTDEVFVLLAGQATLYMGEKREPVIMEPCRMYNVKAGTFHSIEVSRDARVLIAESSDTGKANSKYIYL